MFTKTATRWLTAALSIAALPAIGLAGHTYTGKAPIALIAAKTTAAKTTTPVKLAVHKKLALHKKKLVVTKKKVAAHKKPTVTKLHHKKTTATKLATKHKI